MILNSILPVKYGWAEEAFLANPNHNFHNFHYQVESGAHHAVAMGYYYMLAPKPDGSEYEYIKLISSLGARAIPIRIFFKKSTGVFHVVYSGVGDGRLNPLASLHGIRRINDTFYPIAQKDFEIIKGYAAAKADTSDISITDLNFELFDEHFCLTWIIEDDEWLSFNLVGNWKSKKVVDDLVTLFTENMPWEKYEALFFDSLGSSLKVVITNGEYGGKGTYPSWDDGKLELVQRITAYARNTALTGQDKPYAVFANIWNPHNKYVQQTILNWYAHGKLRLDHYYYEAGGLGTQAPNGVIPGTTIPAYVDPKNLTGAYLPANLVALDDVYGFNRSEFDGTDDYDRAQHFKQHLDACGTAGNYGSWFGWYGEDYVGLKYENKLIYTNDLQLLRAIPNWDNIAGVVVPAYNQTSPTDERHWDGIVYRSSRSYASADVIYSFNPINHEMYIVYRKLEGAVQLPPGLKVEEASFVDEWFTKTHEDALPAIDIQNRIIKLKPKYHHKLFKGIRITFEEIYEPQPNPPKNLRIIHN
jgi:hypothetical protein